MPMSNLTIIAFNDTVGERILESQAQRIRLVEGHKSQKKVNRIKSETAQNNSVTYLSRDQC